MLLCLVLDYGVKIRLNQYLVNILYTLALASRLYGSHLVCNLFLKHNIQSFKFIMKCMFSIKEMHVFVVT